MRPSDAFAAWRRKEARAGDRLPYASLVGSDTLLLRDGALMMVLHVPGWPAETAEAMAINAHAAQTELALRAGLDARFVLYHHVIRRRVELDFAGSFDNVFAAHVDARWQERIGGGALYANDHFITLVRRPPRGKTGWLDRISRRFAQRDDPVDPAEWRALRAATQGLAAALGPAGARILGDYDAEAGPCNELLEFLASLCNGAMHPVRRPADGTDIGHMLPAARLSFGVDAMELRGPDGVSFGALVSIKDYPDATAPGLIDPLLAIDAELVLTETWAPSDRQIARERIDLALRRLRSADEEALAERAELIGARDALGMGSAAWGDHHLSVLVRAPSLAELDHGVTRAAGALADAGAIAVREDLNLEPGFWAQFPGNESYIVRRAMISSANMACFASCHAPAMGAPDGHHWGDAVTVLASTSATPVFLSLHQGDLGNFTLIGPSGSGKTVVLNFLAAQAQRFAPRTVLFDKDRGAELFIRAMRGRYERIVPGVPTGFNPLSLPDSAETRAFLREWLGVLLEARGPDEAAIIAGAVDAAYANAPELRRLTHFRELLGGARRPVPGDLASRLEPWCAGGPHGWLFDNATNGATDRLDLSQRLLGFDMTQVLDAPRLRTPVMQYLFHRIEGRLDGNPAMILIDEGWKALDDPHFAARIRDWLKTLRKRNALVGFATQSARDALDSSIAAALVEQTATMLFTPNPRARAEDYCAGFGLSEHELAIVRNLPPQGRCFLMRQGDIAQVVRLDLDGMDDIVTILSGRESTVRRLDALRETRGDDPAQWYAVLTGMPWPGGGDALSEAAE